jgi:hypothetical protein
MTAGIGGTVRPASAAAPSVTRLAAAAAIAEALDLDAGEFSAQLVAALAMLAQAMGREIAEADWWRLLDALLLVATHPAAS